MTITDEQIEKAARAIDPWAFRELSHSDLMSDDYADTRQRHAQERARKTARAALEAVMPGEPSELERGDYCEGIEEGWKAGAAHERSLWVEAIETYFDATAVEDVEGYVSRARAALEAVMPGELGKSLATVVTSYTIPKDSSVPDPKRHPEPRWPLRAYDEDKQAERDFAVRDCTFAPEPGELEQLREALASAGRSLEWAARRMKDNCCRDSDVAAVRLAAWKTTEARAALAEGGRDE